MQDDCSRRAFLKKFALLSAGTLVLGATTMACYGPGVPRPVPTVLGMYFLDNVSKLAILQYQQNVPVHTTFTIRFSILMDTTQPATITFADLSGASVLFDQLWDSEDILSVAPSSDLLPDTEYRLRVQDVVSKQGEKITLGGDADATFKTVVV